MKISTRPLFISLFVLNSYVSLHADKQADDAAEQRRLDNQRQEQQIQDRKLEDQYYENRRQEQQIEDRKLEDRRAEQRRLDNARQRLVVGEVNKGNEIADRGSKIADRSRGGRDRRDSLRDDQDLMDDTIDEMMLERRQYLEQNQDQYQYGNQYQPQVQGQGQPQPQYGCSGPGCNAGLAGAAGCAGFTCQDPQALHNMEANLKHKEETHQQRKLVVEQWDRDHPRD